MLKNRIIIPRTNSGVRGQKYEYGTVAPIAVQKNHLPSPWNVSRTGELYCVGSGIISESEIEEYKKKILPTIIEQLKSNDSSGKFDNITEDDVEFIEVESEEV